MSLDPQVIALLDARRNSGALAPESLGPEEARRVFRREALALKPPSRSVTARDLDIGLPRGSVRARQYLPVGLAAPAPGLVYFHGGGWVVGDLDTHDALCRHLANSCGAIVVAIDYRLAPEHRYPAAADDAYAATRWIAERSHELGIDPARLAVGGDSAGGNLAAVVTLDARELGTPRISFQLLIYPVTDHGFDKESYVAKAEGFGLTKSSMEWFWSEYLGVGVRGDEPRASPLRATSLAGLPPAYVLTAEHDVLRDEGEAYARRLREARVQVHLERFGGMIHGFVRLTGVLDRAADAIERIGLVWKKQFP
jgi:acetyl esterase